LGDVIKSKEGEIGYRLAFVILLWWFCQF